MEHSRAFTKRRAILGQRVRYRPRELVPFFLFTRGPGDGNKPLLDELGPGVDKSNSVAFVFRKFEFVRRLASEPEAANPLGMGLGPGVAMILHDDSP